MNVPPNIIGQLLTIFMAAQMRGWIDLRGLEPLLKVVVESGNGPKMRALLGELIELLAAVEQGQSVRG